LATDGEPEAVPQAAVALDVAEAVDVLLDLAAETTLDGVVPLKEHGEAGELFFREVASMLLRIDPCLMAKLERYLVADAVQIAQRKRSGLVVRNIDA